MHTVFLRNKSFTAVLLRWIIGQTATSLLLYPFDCWSLVPDFLDQDVYPPGATASLCLFPSVSMVSMGLEFQVFMAERRLSGPGPTCLGGKWKLFDVFQIHILHIHVYIYNASTEY